MKSSRGGGLKKMTENDREGYKKSTFGLTSLVLLERYLCVRGRLQRTSGKWGGGGGGFEISDIPGRGEGGGL